MLPKYRAELFEGKNTWHSSWRVVHLACLHSYVLLGFFLESRMCKLRWLCNVVYGVRLLCTACCVAPCTRSGCWVIEICCRCVWLHWGLGFTSSIDSFFQAKGLLRKHLKYFETYDLTHPAAVLSPIESVGDWLRQGYSFIMGRLTRIFHLIHFTFSLDENCLKIRMCTSLQGFMTLNKGKEEGSRFPDEVLDNIWCEIIWEP